MKVIGLTGDARAGKNTVGRIIAEELDDRVVQEGFSDALKRSASASLGNVSDGVAFCDWLKVHGRVEVFDEFGDVVLGLSGRAFLQRFGTEGHRDVFGSDVWVDVVLPLSGHYTARNDCDVLVLTDVRFENEAQRILEYGGEVWLITRPGTESGEHASEQGLPRKYLSRTIGNASGLGYLRAKVREALLDARTGPLA